MHLIFSQLFIFYDPLQVLKSLLISGQVESGVLDDKTDDNPISMAGLSRWPGEGRYPQDINWSPGFLWDRFLDPSSSPHALHHWILSYNHMVSRTIAMLMTYGSISHFNQMIQR